MVTLLIIDVTLFACFFAMWRRGGWLNLAISTVLLLATIANVYALIKLT